MGLRFGTALFDETGNLLAYESHHSESLDELKESAIPRALTWAESFPPKTSLTHLICEGGAELSSLWTAQAQCEGIVVCAEEWRKNMLLPKEKRGSIQSKSAARTIAKQVIARSRASTRTELNTDASEAILVGHHAVTELRWRTGVLVERYTNGNVVP